MILNKLIDKIIKLINCLLALIVDLILHPLECFLRHFD